MIKSGHPQCFVEFSTTCHKNLAPSSHFIHWIFCTFLNLFVVFAPDPWMRRGWKKTVSPAFISKCSRGISESQSFIPWYIAFTPPCKEVHTSIYQLQWLAGDHLPNTIFNASKIIISSTSITTKNCQRRCNKEGDETTRILR